jgi:hypothetical protein
MRSRPLRLATEAARQVTAKFGRVVLTGPFAGMKYVETSFGSAYPPKLLGTYELELRGVMEEIAKRSYGRIVDIGAAEGYYTVGLARMHEGAQVIGYETQAAAHQVLGNLALYNGVENRVYIKGFCTTNSLAVDLRDGKGRLLVVSDCEGWEQTLLTPEGVGGLARADMLVETHDFLQPLVARTIRKRFAETHEVEEIRSVPRRIEDWPEQAAFVGEKYRLSAMAEHRPEGQTWLWMKAKK